MRNLIGTVDGAVAKIVIDKSIPQGNAATGFVGSTKEVFCRKIWRQSLVKGSPPTIGALESHRSVITKRGKDKLID